MATATKVARLAYWDGALMRTKYTHTHFFMCVCVQAKFMKQKNVRKCAFDGCSYRVVLLLLCDAMITYSQPCLL